MTYKSCPGILGRSNRPAISSAAALDNSASGSKAQTCHTCFRMARDTRETVSNGLRLIRVRYGLPYSELPYLEPSCLTRFLSFLLLQGQERASVLFPRRQRWGGGADTCVLQRLCRRDRWGLAHSVASIKRNLPSGCRRHTPSARSAWEANAYSNPPSPSSEYLRFVRSGTRKLFPFGWDREYESFVNSHAPNATARHSGGRADRSWSRQCGGGEELFRRQCLSNSLSRTVFRARYKEVLSAGKVRPLVIFDDKIDLLGPLHKMIYNHLSTFEWLLVGPPTEKKIASLCVGEYQTSVDLVSATDGLSLPVTDAILTSLFSKSVCIPAKIKLLAFSSLQPLVDGCEGMGEVTHGQMMGSYLSFPLLCLQSYFAALWAVRGLEAKILVNGDDTLISAPIAIDSSCYPEGFKLNSAKTIRAKNVAEINSTAFLRGKGGKWRVVDHLRRGGFLTDYPGMLHAAAACRGSLAWTDSFIRSRIGKKWGFFPSQLGLYDRSFVAFCRERELGRRRLWTPLPVLSNENDPELLAVRRELDPDEKLATTFHIVNFGRSGGMKRDQMRLSIGALRRTYMYRQSAPWRTQTYLSVLGGIKAKRLFVHKEEQVRYVPQYYTSKREEDGIRALRCLLVDS
nr:MAG: putative RNA-dependent RNA polymerase [Botourmiaviridae sp.]